MMMMSLCWGNGLKLMLGLGLSVARGGEFAVGFPDYGDADVNG